MSLFDQPTFEAFYERYPRKKAPGRAEKAYDKAIKIVSPEDLQEAVTALRALWDDHIKGMDTKERNTAKGWFPYPATWLNDKGWNDEEITEYLLRPEENKPEPIVFDEDDPFKAGKEQLLRTFGPVGYRCWFDKMVLTRQPNGEIIACFHDQKRSDGGRIRAIFLRDWVRKTYEKDLVDAFNARVRFTVAEKSDV